MDRGVESTRASAREPRWLLELALAAAPLALVGVLPWSRLSMSLARYLPLHSFMETFAVVVAMLVFAIDWSTGRERDRGGLSPLGVGFLAVGLLDCAHLFSFATMPAFVTPSGPEKAIYFWIAARFIAAATMLTVPLQKRPPRIPRVLASVIAVGIALAVYAAVLFDPRALPAVYVEGVGLTNVKIGAEAVVTLLYAIAFVLLVKRGAQALPEATAHLGRAAMLMMLGEVPFALYRSIADGFNFTGHVYKVLAYFFVYRAVFVYTVRRPYEELRTSLGALRESEERFRQLSENIREVFWLRETDSGRFLFLSAGFRAVFGRAADASPSLAWLATLVHPEDRELFAREIEKQNHGVAHTFEYRVVGADGEARWLRATSFPVAKTGSGPRKVAGITADITEEKRTNELVARAQRMEGLGRFAGGVAHDFNNLLTVVFASLELAIDTLPKGHEARADLEQTLEAATRARELTGQLLSFAKRRPGEARRIELGELVAASSAMWRPMLGADVELSVLIDPGEHGVRVDPGQLDQVLLNLVTNAKDAMPAGGRIVVSVGRLDEAPEGLDGAAKWVRLRVEDSGTGMSADVVKHAFEPFYTTKGPGKGTGLGLATSFGIVAQAGGTIVVDSELGRGTRMDVLLPLSEGPIERPGAAPSGLRDPRGTETILLAEDEPAVRDFTARVLRQNGYRVLVAANGLEALEIAEGHEGRIDLLLSDVVMPLMGGAELAHRLCAARSDLRVLFVTGYAGEAQGSFAHPLFAKPYTGSALLARIRKHLDAPLARDGEGALA